MEGFETRAIFQDDEMIGFVMYGLHPHDDNYWIYRFMIDGKFQGMHYAKPAIRLVLDEIRHSPTRTDDVMLCYKTGNERAKRLYAQIGFTEVGYAPGEI